MSPEAGNALTQTESGTCGRVETQPAMTAGAQKVKSRHLSMPPAAGDQKCRTE